MKASLKQVNVLVVDDKPESLFAIESALREPGLSIVKANSGNDALGKLLEDDFSCVLLDVEMPEMDGFEVARLIREDANTRHIPIMFITAHAAEGDRFHGYQAGAVDYLFKPLDPNVLRSKVRVFAELYRRSEIIADQSHRLNASLEEQRRITQVLERKTEELAHSNAELEQFASIASHDLKEPLRVVRSYLGLLQRTAKLDDRETDFLNSAKDATGRMQELVDDLLRYARLGEQVKSAEAIDCSRVFDTVVKDLGKIIEETNGRITRDELPMLNADDTHLRQIIQNLITNALKFRCDRLPEVHVSAEDRGNQWLFSVRDNGIGIAPEYKERIFLMFQRLHGKDKYSGNGIGLAVCKKLISRYGGNIWVESEIGVGSTFFFTFPKVPIAELKTAQMAP